MTSGDSHVDGPSPLRAVLRAPWADRALLLEAAVVLAVARIALLTLPFRVVSARLGVHMAQTSLVDDPAQTSQARRAGWAIRAVSSRLPWRTKCLEQAVAAKLMLRRRRIPNTMYLGVSRAADGARPLEAHAWVRSGTLHVTGGAEVGGYAVVSTFADQQRSQPA